MKTCLISAPDLQTALENGFCVIGRENTEGQLNYKNR